MKIAIQYNCNTLFIDSYGLTFQTPGSSGVDLRADIPAMISIAAKQCVTISTGMSFELPSGYEGQVRSRSGLASKHGIFMLNAPGTIDADYRGIVSVVVANFSDKDFVLRPGDRIAQFVICPVPEVEYQTANTLSETARGTGGFGSTGLQ